MKIEWTRTQSGQHAVICDGKWLCSSIDPQTEGRSWVERYASVFKAESKVLVLGVGAGWHLREARVRFADTKIRTIDFARLFYEKARVLFPELNDVEFCDFGEIEAPNKSVVLPFYPCWQSNKFEFSRAFEKLTGRENKDGMLKSIHDIDTNDPIWKSLKELVS